MSNPTKRLEAISQQLSPAEKKTLATRFRPALPAGLAPSFTPLNPLTFLLKAASIRPNHIGLSHPETHREWTFAQWAERVAQLAYALRSRGIGAGDKVLVCCPNVPMISDALQAIAAIQAVIVPINTRLTEGEVAFLLENSDAKFVLVDHESAHLVASANVPVVVATDGTPGCAYEKFLLEGAAYDKAMGGHEWAGLEFNRDENATFAICYTSGTTSQPKGVETSYRGTYLAAVANAVESGLVRDANNAKYLWILPKFHCLGWCFFAACTMSMITQVCMRSVGNYDQIWDLLNNGGVTHYSGAPTVQLSISQHPHARKLNRYVSTTVAGAAPTSSLINALEGLGIDVTHVYGLTETLGPMSRNYALPGASGEVKARLDSAFLTADDIRIVKMIPEGEELTTKVLEEVRNDGTEVGEIVTRGNITMLGYYKSPEATAKAFAGGYFHTGDLAVRFADGSFAIQDRAKDIIISGGENASSLAIESRLTTHPDVSEVAVVARADEKWGERPHAFVVLKNPSKWIGKSAEFEIALKEFSKPLLPGFARPAWVEIVDALEKTSTGKVSKKTLRDQLKARK